MSNDAQWECQCYNGWDGKDCSVLLEQNCNDGRDNDKGTVFKRRFIFLNIILIWKEKFDYYCYIIQYVVDIIRLILKFLNNGKSKLKIKV